MSSAGATARLIAAGTILGVCDHRLRQLVPPGAAAWCRRLLLVTPEGLRLLASVRSHIGRAAWRLLEAALARGILRHWLLRKRCIEALARRASAEGFGNLVVLGTGMDSLALRLAQERAFARVLMVDRPELIDHLRAALGRDEPGPALIAINVAAEGLDRAVLPHLDRSARTLVIAEGLLMYLDPGQVRALLRDLAQLPGGGRLVATYMDAPPGRPIGFRHASPLVDAWLRRRGEPMRWSIADPDLPAFLGAAGWSHTQTIRAADLSREHAAGARPFEGENLFVAERRG